MWKNHAVQSLFTPTGNLRQFVAGVLLSVFIALSIVPAGFMPDFAAKDGTLFKICSGLGQKDIALDDNGQPQHKQNQQNCAFAFNLSGAPLPQPAILVASIFSGAALYSLTPFAFTKQQFTLPSGARAPPTL